MNDQIAGALHRRIDVLTQQSACLQDYLALKVDQKDWHGVADAANDIREVETEIDGVKYALDEMKNAEQVRREVWVGGQRVSWSPTTWPDGGATAQ